MFPVAQLQEPLKTADETVLNVARGSDVHKMASGAQFHILSVGWCPPAGQSALRYYVVPKSRQCFNTAGMFLNGVLAAIIAVMLDRGQVRNMHWDRGGTQRAAREVCCPPGKTA